MSKVNFGVTFDADSLASLDRIRGDIPRSVFLQRLVEKRIRKTGVEKQ